METLMRIPLTVITLLCLGLFACSDQVAGQKGKTELSTNLDSVSYGIGTDIGHNMLQSGLDSLNVDAIALGIKDGIAGSEKMQDENIRTLVQAYMLEAQKKAMEAERVEGLENKAKGDEWIAENASKEGIMTTGSGLQYQIIQEGEGAKPGPEDKVKVDYRGTLIDGTEFDSSYKRGEPAVFGVNQVIPGWVEGLQLMNKGATYRFFIKSDLAYGPSKGPGGKLPPHSALIFDVVLLDINPE
jgi:FKBP-type peptidyl-prolyl cis-trans isomerase